MSASLNRRSENIPIFAIIIAELELGDIERHIFPAHFVERADNAALENRPEALDGLRVDCADDVLASGVINGGVRIVSETAIAGPLICAKQADFVRDGFSHKGVKSGRLDVCNHARNHIALACDSTDNWSFTGADTPGSAAAPAFIPMPVLGQAANESFIDFDNAAKLPNVFHESSSDLVAHEPSGPVRSEAHVAIDLQSTYPFLARQHEMDHAEPLPQRLIGVLEDRPGDMGEAVVSGGRRAFVAQPIPLHCAVPLDLHVATTRASHAFWPTAPGEIGATSIFVGESFFPSGDGHLVDWLELLCAGHIGLSFSAGANMAYPISQVKHNRPI
jgi:hypothetical protein